MTILRFDDHESRVATLARILRERAEEQEELRAARRSMPEFVEQIKRRRWW
jgi:hypothetical protein